MAEEANITKDDKVFLGEDRVLEFEILDADGNPIDVSGWAMTWIVRASDTTTAAAVLTKTTASGITVTGTYDANRATNTQRVAVAIADTDTWPDSGTPLKPKKYRHSLKRTDAGSETILAFGDFVLREATARA